MAMKQPALIWDCDRNPEEALKLDEMLSYSPNIEPIGVYENPDHLVTCNGRIPAALHERLLALSWETRSSVSELMRALLWEAVQGFTFVEVNMEVAPAEEEPVKPAKRVGRAA